MRKSALASTAILSLLALSGCSGSGPDETIQDQDTAYQQAMDTGSQALAIERYTVAERSYREAARLALRRDDASAIGDASYNLAVTQLAANEAPAALETVRNARNALAMRHGEEASAQTGGLPKTTHGGSAVNTDTGALDLVAAAAEYRLGQLPQAEQEAHLASQAPDTDIALRGAFVSGLVASRQGNGVTLNAAINMLQTAKLPHSAAQQGDLAELQALQALAGNPTQAMEFASTAVKLRRETGDYQAMARALALEAQAARAAGQGTRASALFAQAAQSIGATAGTDDKPAPEASRYMNESNLLAPVQPFKAKDTTP
ncbi:outer membrane protein assembly factor BamD [Acetobacter conturbans]|uniref:Uncharacterized protein n=1 Tax=Acetobacter conturbans TaxID=1737472 RepID=A0ABX0JYI9_9PROT|nr:hypothetical protein [Acetobacter conturbans]NHN87505.1 hypothetical protein [Acetobacter conturbans]